MGLNGVRLDFKIKWSLTPFRSRFTPANGQKHSRCSREFAMRRGRGLTLAIQSLDTTGG